MDLLRAAPVALLLLALTGSARAQGRSPAGTPVSGGESPVSARVLASWIARAGGDGAARLEFVILWRGTPGWYRSGGFSGRSSFGRDERILRKANGDSVVLPARPAVADYAIGGVRFGYEFDPRGRVLTLLGRTSVVRPGTVVLVDGVGSAQGARVAGSTQVEPTLPVAPAVPGRVGPRTPDLASALRLSPLVADFIRDRPPPDRTRTKSCSACRVANPPQAGQRPRRHDLWALDGGARPTSGGVP